MKTYTPDQLAAILAAHREWLVDSSKGKRADLSDSNLRYSDMRGSNLRGSNLRGSILRGSNLSDSDLRGSILPAFLIVPQQGSFIAWKKASGVVVKLEIPADAKRCNSLVGRKCRAEFVRVLAIDGDTTPGKSVNGSHNHSIIYTVGGITRPDKYDDDIRVECTNGIHFFITYEEAKEYL